MAAPIAIERSTVQNTLLNICSEHAQFMELDMAARATIVRRLERNCLEVTLAQCIQSGIDRTFADAKFRNRYSCICYRVLANLGPGSVLINGLIDGTVNAYKVALMTSYELCPAASEELRKIIEIRRSQTAIKKTSSVYKCKKCGNNRTITIEYQARAADESASKSIKCIVCEFTWPM